MDIPALEAFVAVANSGSFSEASQSLHITQPAVSKRVAQLESQLGERLFDRVGRQVLLTEAGQTLLPRARHILAEAQDAIRALNNLKGEVGGTLTLGTSHHVGLHRLPPVLRTYSARYPQVNLDLRFLDSEQACLMVGRGELELALVTLPDPLADELVATPIWHDRLRVALGIDHPLAALPVITLRELAEHAAILPPPGSFTRELIDRLFAAQGLKIQARMSTSYLETIKMMVSVGLGWSVLPETMLDAQTLARVIDDTPMQRELGVVQHVRRTPSNAGLAMLALLRERGDTA